MSFFSTCWRSLKRESQCNVLLYSISEMTSCSHLSTPPPMEDFLDIAFTVGVLVCFCGSILYNFWHSVQKKSFLFWGLTNISPNTITHVLIKQWHNEQLLSTVSGRKKRSQQSSYFTNVQEPASKLILSSRHMSCCIIGTHRNRLFYGFFKVCCYCDEEMCYGDCLKFDYELHGVI